MPSKCTSSPPSKAAKGRFTKQGAMTQWPYCSRGCAVTTPAWRVKTSSTSSTTSWSVQPKKSSPSRKNGGFGGSLPLNPQKDELFHCVNTLFTYGTKDHPLGPTETRVGFYSSVFSFSSTPPPPPPHPATATFWRTRVLLLLFQKREGTERNPEPFRSRRTSCSTWKERKLEAPCCELQGWSAFGASKEGDLEAVWCELQGCSALGVWKERVLETACCELQSCCPRGAF